MADSDEAIPTADPDAVQTPEIAPPSVPPARRSGLFPAVAGGAIAAILGFAAAQFVPDGWPLQSNAETAATLATQAAALATVEQEITRLSAALAAVEARPAVDPALADRVVALEQRPLSVDLALPARIEALESEFAAMASMPGDGTGASAAALAAQAAALEALQAEVARLKGSAGSAADSSATAEAIAAQLAEAEARAAALRSEAEANAAHANARAALRQIAVALETGGPFESALSAFAETDLPEVLARNAATGLPALTDLQATFPDAARKALDVALRADMGEGWTERFTSFLRSQTGARSTTPREGDDPDAVLSRIEAALSAGLVTDALALMPALPQVSQDVMADWTAKAQTYLSGQAALATLTTVMGAQE